MQKISELYQSTDTPAVVVAAGPSTEKDLYSITEPTIGIGINHHCDTYLECTEYNVFMDAPDKDTPIEFNTMANTPGKRICCHEKYTDYLLDVSFADWGFTAPLAVWVACFITSGKVSLAGFDLWQSRDTQTHFYKHEPEKTRHLMNVQEQLVLWDSIFNTLPRKRISAISGPLQEILNHE